jgi:glycerol uptake facilitator-like aquaporin
MVTFARMFSDTFAGIAPSSVPGFIAFQLVGAAIAVGAIRVLYPDAPRVASRVVVPHDADTVEHPEPSRDRR